MLTPGVAQVWTMGSHRESACDLEKHLSGGLYYCFRFGSSVFCLLSLRPELHISHEKPDCDCARPVLAMYVMLERVLAYAEPSQTPAFVRKCIDIAQLFGQKYRMFTAMSLVAIVLGQVNAGIAQAFREANFGSE